MTKFEKEMLCKIYYKYPEQTKATIKKIDDYLSQKRAEEMKKREDEFYESLCNMTEEERGDFLDYLHYLFEVRAPEVMRENFGGR